MSLAFLTGPFLFLFVVGDSNRDPPTFGRERYSQSQGVRRGQFDSERCRRHVPAERGQHLRQLLHT